MIHSNALPVHFGVIGPHAGVMGAVPDLIELQPGRISRCIGPDARRNACLSPRDRHSPSPPNLASRFLANSLG
jgi:hypothetical protein